MFYGPLHVFEFFLRHRFAANIEPVDHGDMTVITRKHTDRMYRLAIERELERMDLLDMAPADVIQAEADKYRGSAL